MAALHPANHALLTMTAVGVKMISNCAPALIIDQLTPEELMEFRAELSEAEMIVEQVRKNVDASLRKELAPVE